MKKYFAILLAAMLMVGAASQAMAYFAADSLMRVIYDTGTGTIEVGSDLGLASTLSTTAPNAGVTVGPAVSLTDFGTGRTTSTLFVAYVAKTSSNAVGPYYFSGALFDGTNAPSTNGNQRAQENGYVNGMQTGYASVAGGTNKAITSTGDANSFFVKMNGGTGNFGNWFPSNNAAGELSLAALAHPGDFVDQTLYKFTTNVAETGTVTITLRTLVGADGNLYTQINPSAVPIPPSVLLLGSGLLGMIGIRRKISG